jgi:hypothetical protein
VNIRFACREQEAKIVMKSMKKDWYKKGWTSAMAKIMEIIAKETKGKSYHKQEMR